MLQNRLSLNVKKTKMMLVGSRHCLRNTPSFSISLNGERVENVTSFKYLGLILDSNLRFHSHVDYIVEKTTAKLGILYKTRWLFDLPTAEMLYCSLVTPLFDFGNTVYTMAAQYQTNRLQVIQNAAARLILLADSRCMYTSYMRGWDATPSRQDRPRP